MSVEDPLLESRSRLKLVDAVQARVVLQRLRAFLDGVRRAGDVRLRRALKLGQYTRHLKRDSGDKT